MSGKQRRLRQKRRIEIISKHQKRAKQRLNAKYQSLVLASIPICSSALMLGMTSRWIHNMGSLRISVADTINMYNELRRRSNAVLEGSD